MSSTRRIICICSGNICRSPMAVALLRHRLEKVDEPVVVISAGTLGIQGRRADEFARRAIAEHDPEMSTIIDEHRSQGISPQMLEMADDIIVMAPRHEEAVRRLGSPAVEQRIVRLWEYAPNDVNLRKIPDPVGHDADVFRHCRNLIEQCLHRWLEDADNGLSQT